MYRTWYAVGLRRYEDACATEANPINPRVISNAEQPHIGLPRLRYTVASLDRPVNCHNIRYSEMYILRWNDRSFDMESGMGADPMPRPSRRHGYWLS